MAVISNRSRKVACGGISVPSKNKTNLSGKTILIPRGSSGIGFKMAREFLAANNTVIITGRNMDKLEKAKAEFGDVITKRSLATVSNQKSVWDNTEKETSVLAWQNSSLLRWEAW